MPHDHPHGVVKREIRFQDGTYNPDGDYNEKIQPVEFWPIELDPSTVAPKGIKVLRKSNLAFPASKNKAQTPSDSKEFIEKYFKALEMDWDRKPGSYSVQQNEYLTGWKDLDRSYKGDMSVMSGEKNISAQESREMIESFVDHINNTKSSNVKSKKVLLDYYNYLLSLSDDDLPNSYRGGAETYPAFFDTSMMDKAPLLGPPKNNQPLKQLMKSNASVPTSKRNTELMYKLNANMRTGQEPDKYKVWDEKGKKWSMRDVEPEELEYYRNKNKIQERQNIKASFKAGGRVRQYQDGGKEPGLKVTKTSPDPPSILQKLANMYNWKENLSENITPYNYQEEAWDDKGKELLGMRSPFKRLYDGIVLDKKETSRSKYERQAEYTLAKFNPPLTPEQIEAGEVHKGFGGGPLSNPENKERMDLLNMLVGRDQVYNTIRPSLYKPTKAEDSDVTYYSSDVTERKLINQLSLGEGFSVDELIKRNTYSNVLGNYTLDKGEDKKGSYLSYYDKWDVNPLSDLNPGRGADYISRGLENAIQSVVGLNPTEIYGRIYYDPETGKPIKTTAGAGGEFKAGGRVRQYQDGGDVNDLLSMLNAHKGADPKDKEVLSNLIPESTQPSGYTQPRLPIEKKIDLIDKPLTNEEMFGAIKPMYEGQNPNTAWMYGAMNNMPPSVAKKWRDENPGTSPEGINMMGVLGAAGYASLGVVIPGTSNIVGGVTIGDALNAYFFKEGIEGGIKHIPEFIDDPSWSGANDITWDALKVLPSMQGLKNNVLKPFVDAYKKAKKASTTASTATSSPLQQLASGGDNILLSDKSVPSLYEARAAGLIGHGLTSQKPVILSLQKKLVDVGLYNSIDEAKVAMDEIRNPSMNTILPTSGKTIGQIMKETQSSLLDYYTNPSAKDRLTKIYGEVRGSSKVIPSSLPGLSKYHADPADLLKYKESYGLSGVEILDELYNKTGMLPRYYASTDKIKETPSFGDISKGMDVGIYDEPFEKFLSRRFKEKASTNPDEKGALMDLAMAEYIEKNVAQAAAGVASDPITGVKKLGMATGGLNAIGALETFGLSQLAEMISKGTNIPISYAENYLSDVIYHELNHIHFGSDELPIEIIDGWTPYLTQDATNLMYKGGSQLEMTAKNALGRPSPKGILQYKSQPVEIQARMGQTRRHLEVSLGYTKNEIENIALAAREESGDAILGKQGGMSFFGADDGAGGKYIQSSFTRIENKLKELGVVNENRSLQKVLDDLTEAAQRTDDAWYNKVIGGNNEEAKAQSLMGLLWRVPVYIGAAGASTSMMQEDDMSKLPILGYKKGGALKGLVKKYGAGGSVGGWGAQGNFTTEYTSKQPDVEELEDPNLIPELNALAAQQESGSGEPLTPEEERKLKGKKALQGAGKGAMAGASFGPWGAVIGGVVGGAIGYFAKQGAKIKKSLYDNGGIFEALREKTAERRIAKTPVRDANSSDLLDMLDNYKESVGVPAGQYDPKEREIVMFKDDPDTLKHEQVHASQYGPLQRLAYRVDSDRSARIQDPTTRKSYRKLTSGKDMVDDRTFNPAGQYILGKGEEFEAVLGTGVNAAKEKGVNFNASFEEILSQLKNIPSPTNNMKGLMKFMSNKFTTKQRDLILKSIR